MSSGYRIFVGGITAAGAATIALSLGFWQSRDVTLYCLYLYVALLATGLRVRRTLSAGPMPVRFLFILVGLPVLSLPETVLLGCTSALLEWAGRLRRGVRSPDASFQVAAAALAAAATHLAYHSPLAELLHLNSMLAMLLAATVFFTFKTLLLAGAAALQNGLRFQKVWQDSHLWSYPYYVVGAAIAGMFNLSGAGLNWQVSITLISALYMLHRSYRLHLQGLRHEKLQAEQMAQLHLQTVEALAAAVEARDHDTHEHLKRVQLYALELGKELALSDVQMESLRAASILHDIGKVAVPEHILGKPGKLTRGEFDRVKIHPIVGAEILARVAFPYPLAAVVRAHHEHWDGRGYPDGLAGEEIPLTARVLSVVDCLDALTSDRPYRRALPLEEAVRRMSAEAGTSFDPRVMAALNRRYVDIAAMAQMRCAAVARIETVGECAPHAAPAAGFCPVEAVAARQDVHAAFEMAEDLRESLSMNEALSVLAERLQTVVQHDSLALYVSEDGWLLPRYVAGESRRELASLRIPQGQVPSGWMENGAPLVNATPAMDPRLPALVRWPDSLRSALAVPLEGPSGTLGVLSLFRTQENAFTEEQLRLVQEIAPSISATVRSVFERHEEHPDVLTDYLTGLPNARALLAHLDVELKRAQRTGEPLSLILLASFDDGAIPDGRGARQRSRVLRLTGRTLKSSCRQYDCLARWEANGFALVLPGLSAASVLPKARQFCREVDQALRQTFGEPLLVLRDGAATWPEDGLKAEALLGVAQERLHAQSTADATPQALSHQVAASC